MRNRAGVLILGILVLFMISTVAWSNGTQESDEKDSYMIGGVMYDLSNKFHTYIQEGMRRFDEATADVEITFTDGKADANQQINQVETLITRGADAIVIVPVEPSTLPMIIEKCRAAKVKLIVTNLLPNEEDLPNIDAYVGSESIDAGLMQAEWVAEELNGKGNVGILIGDLGLEVARMRTQGNKDIFAKYPGINVVREAEGKWDRAQGLRIAENWIQADTSKELNAIVCNNDEMAIGAYFAAQQAGRDDIIIVGIDATPDALEFLGQGLDVTVYQSGYGQGYGSAETAYKLIKGDNVDKMVWIPFELVTPEKRDEYIAKWK